MPQPPPRLTLLKVQGPIQWQSAPPGTSRNLGEGTPAASLNCFQVDRNEKEPVQVYLESKTQRKDQALARSALAAPYYVLNQDSKPFSLEVTPPTEPGRPGHVVGHPSPSSACRPNLLFESSRGKTDEVKSVVSHRDTPRSRSQPPPPTARSPSPSGGPQSAGGSYTFGDSLGPNCRLLTSKGMVKGCLCGEEDLMGDEEFYPIDYKKEPGAAPLITWKKKKTDKYGTLLVQRGKSNMVVKIPIHDQQAGQLKTDSSTFYNFCMVVILLMGAMWAYIY